jgi:hypothetical protein
MPRTVTINSNVRDIVLPNGLRYPGGAVVTLSDQDYSKLSATFKTGKLSADTAVAGSDYFATQAIASGETSVPRLNVGSTAPLLNQKLQLTYWTAARTETINNIGTISGGTAAGATPTYCAMGCYSVASNGNLTLMGACANDTTLFAATFTEYIRAVTTPFQKIQGQRYAFGILVVSAFTMPTIEGYNGTIGKAASPPILCQALITQSTLPASITSGSLSGTASMFFGEVTP